MRDQSTTKTQLKNHFASYKQMLFLFVLRDGLSRLGLPLSYFLVFSVFYCWMMSIDILSPENMLAVLPDSSAFLGHLGASLCFIRLCLPNTATHSLPEALLHMRIRGLRSSLPNVKYDNTHCLYYTLFTSIEQDTNFIGNVLRSLRKNQFF